MTIQNILNQDWFPQDLQKTITEYLGTDITALDDIDRSLIYNGYLHDQTHVDRVVILGTILAAKTNMPRATYDLALTAFKYHDIGRTNDDIDPEHGRRGTTKLPNINPVVKEVMILHSLGDGYLKKLDKKSDAYIITTVLKDADGLDRVRLDDLDTSFLRHDVSHTLIDFAKLLCKNHNNNITTGYHITKATKVPAIMRSGLPPRVGTNSLWAKDVHPCVSFTPSQDDITDWKQRLSMATEVPDADLAVLKLDLTGCTVKHKSPAARDIGDYYVDNTIPPEKITLFQGTPKDPAHTPEQNAAMVEKLAAYIKNQNPNTPKFLDVLHKMDIMDKHDYFDAHGVTPEQLEQINTAITKLERKLRFEKDPTKTPTHLANQFLDVVKPIVEK